MKNFTLEFHPATEPMPKEGRTLVFYEREKWAILEYVGTNTFGEGAWENEHGLTAYVAGDEPEFMGWAFLPYTLI